MELIDNRQMINNIRFNKIKKNYKIRILDCWYKRRYKAIKPQITNLNLLKENQIQSMFFIDYSLYKQL